MSDETIVAVYDTAAHAALAVADLRAADVPESAITQHAQNATGAGVTASTGNEPGFWSSLFGGEPDHNTAVYGQSMQSGSTVVSVKTPTDMVEHVTMLLERHNPIDLDDRAATYGLTHTASSSAMAPAVSGVAMGTAVAGMADTGTMQLSEERLAIGKRVINRGGTRIRRFVVETPVEEQVRLRDEKVVLERHPVTDGRPVTGADFSEKTIEMTESGEEVVVSKTAHVVEEIGLRKEQTDRVETVRDTVRREDVKVETIPGTATSTVHEGLEPTTKI